MRVRRPSSARGDFGGAATGAAVALLMLVFLVVGLRGPEQPSEAQSAVPVSGAMALGDGVGWSWTGPAGCRLDATAEPVRSTTGRATQRHEIPLTTVLALAAQGGAVVAVGLDAECDPALLRRSSTAAGWTPVEASPAVAVDLDPTGTLWLVPRDDPSTLQRLEPGAVPAVLDPGCPQEQRLADVSSPTGVDIWALCEDPFGTHRTLLRSRDGGASFAPVADDLSGSGLDGTATARSLAVGHDGHGWLLLGGRRCAEGDLRRTEDGGATWTDLPCVHDTVELDRLLDVDRTDDGKGALVGLRSGVALLALTENDGYAWRPAG